MLKVKVDKEKRLCKVVMKGDCDTCANEVMNAISGMLDDLTADTPELKFKLGMALVADACDIPPVRGDDYKPTLEQLLNELEVTGEFTDQILEFVKCMGTRMLPSQLSAINTQIACVAEMHNSSVESVFMELLAMYVHAEGSTLEVGKAVAEATKGTKCTGEDGCENCTCEGTCNEEECTGGDNVSPAE